jgi:hypothetical protein
MIRLLGFLLGSAISVVVILLVLGPPEILSNVPPEPPATPVEVIQEPEVVVAEESPLPDIESVPPPAPEVPVAPLEDNVALKWHSFWSPFASQIAANGFVSRLEAVTGYDYRVVKIETGIYEVTFAYTDETERRDKLSVIASATGLELPDS